jgi:hypothetical protein
MSILSPRPKKVYSLPNFYYLILFFNNHFALKRSFNSNKKVLVGGFI